MGFWKWYWEHHKQTPKEKEEEKETLRRWAMMGKDKEDPPKDKKDEPLEITFTKDQLDKIMFERGPKGCTAWQESWMNRGYNIRYWDNKCIFWKR